MKSIDFTRVKINDGFWKVKQDMCKNTTVKAVYDRFVDTYRFAALECNWKEGDEPKAKPHFFWDSDVAKWIEGAAYILEQNDMPELEAICDNAIENIVKNADENGYFNSYFLVVDEPKFSNRDRHELYCLGHLIEAAIAYYNATGKDRLLKAMCRFADYVEKVFKTEGTANFATPGHPEPELALYKLYKATNEKRYLELLQFFIDSHGANDKDGDSLYKNASTCYNQDEMPLRARSTADGHCVRALYLLCGMADLAAETEDRKLLAACERCFENIANRRMYITGGVGSASLGEAFTVDFDLPNRTAYAETCAAIALVLFCHRMLNITGEAKYADVIERAMYNGVLSGISMDGRSFFYENPLEIDLKFNDVDKAVINKRKFSGTQRVAVFGCSCCPPNMVRFIPSVGNYVLSEDDSTLFINQYMGCEADFGNTHIQIKTAYPVDGTVKISGKTDKKRLALRIPAWCDSFKLNCGYELKAGYAYIKVEGEWELSLELDMPVKVMAADPRVHANSGRVAVTRGPVVYCGEAVDNGDDLKSVMIDIRGEFVLGDTEFIVPILKTVGYKPTNTDSLYSIADDSFEKIPLTLIPYYAFANRGNSDMLVWFLRK